MQGQDSMFSTLDPPPNIGIHPQQGFTTVELHSHGRHGHNDKDSPGAVHDDNILNQQQRIHTECSSPKDMQVSPARSPVASPKPMNTDSPRAGDANELNAELASSPAALSRAVQEAVMHLFRAQPIAGSLSDVPPLVASALAQLRKVDAALLALNPAEAHSNLANAAASCAIAAAVVSVQRAREGSQPASGKDNQAPEQAGPSAQETAQFTGPALGVPVTAPFPFAAAAGFHPSMLYHPAAQGGMMVPHILPGMPGLPWPMPAAFSHALNPTAATGAALLGHTSWPQQPIADCVATQNQQPAEEEQGQEQQQEDPVAGNAGSHGHGVPRLKTRHSRRGSRTGQGLLEDGGDDSEADHHQQQQGGQAPQGTAAGARRGGAATRGGGHQDGQHGNARTYRFIIHAANSTWRAQVGYTDPTGHAKKLYGGHRPTAKEAAHDADMLLYKTRGLHAPFNMPLTAKEKQHVDSLTLEQLLEELARPRPKHHLQEHEDEDEAEGDGDIHHHYGAASRLPAGMSISPPPTCVSPTPVSSALDAASALMFMSRDAAMGQGPWQPPMGGQKEGPSHGGPKAGDRSKQQDDQVEAANLEDLPGDLDNAASPDEGVGGTSSAGSGSQAHQQQHHHHGHGQGHGAAHGSQLTPEPQGIDIPGTTAAATSSMHLAGSGTEHAGVAPKSLRRKRTSYQANGHGTGSSVPQYLGDGTAGSDGSKHGPSPGKHGMTLLGRFEGLKSSARLSQSPPGVTKLTRASPARGGRKSSSLMKNIADMDCEYAQEMKAAIEQQKQDAKQHPDHSKHHQRHDSEGVDTQMNHKPRDVEGDGRQHHHQQRCPGTGTADSGSHESSGPCVSSSLHLGPAVHNASPSTADDMQATATTITAGEVFQSGHPVHGKSHIDVSQQQQQGAFHSLLHEMLKQAQQLQPEHAAAVKTEHTCCAVVDIHEASNGVLPTGTDGLPWAHSSGHEQQGEAVAALEQHRQQLELHLAAAAAAACSGSDHMQDVKQDTSGPSAAEGANAGTTAHDCSRNQPMDEDSRQQHRQHALDNGMQCASMTRNAARCAEGVQGSKDMMIQQQDMPSSGPMQAVEGAGHTARKHSLTSAGSHGNAQADGQDQNANGSCLPSGISNLLSAGHVQGVQASVGPAEGLILNGPSMSNGPASGGAGGRAPNLQTLTAQGLQGLHALNAVQGLQGLHLSQQLSLVQQHLQQQQQPLDKDGNATNSASPMYSENLLSDYTACAAIRKAPAVIQPKGSIKTSSLGSSGGAFGPGPSTGVKVGPGAEKTAYRYIVRIGSRWRAQVGQVDAGTQKKWYGPYVDDPALAAQDADKILYKLRGPNANTNFPLSPEVRSQLDGMTLAQLLQSFKTHPSVNGSLLPNGGHNVNSQVLPHHQPLMPWHGTNGEVLLQQAIHSMGLHGQGLTPEQVHQLLVASIQQASMMQTAQGVQDGGDGPTQQQAPGQQQQQQGLPPGHKPAASEGALEVSLTHDTKDDGHQQQGLGANATTLQGRNSHQLLNFEHSAKAAGGIAGSEHHSNSGNVHATVGVTGAGLFPGNAGSGTGPIPALPQVHLDLGGAEPSTQPPPIVTLPPAGPHVARRQSSTNSAAAAAGGINIGGQAAAVGGFVHGINLGGPAGPREASGLTSRPSYTGNNTNVNGTTGALTAVPAQGAQVGTPAGHGAATAGHQQQQENAALVHNMLHALLQGKAMAVQGSTAAVAAQHGFAGPSSAPSMPTSKPAGVSLNTLPPGVPHQHHHYHTVSMPGIQQLGQAATAAAALTAGSGVSQKLQGHGGMSAGAHPPVIPTNTMLGFRPGPASNNGHSFGQPGQTLSSAAAVHAAPPPVIPLDAVLPQFLASRASAPQPQQ